MGGLMAGRPDLIRELGLQIGRLQILLEQERSCLLDLRHQDLLELIPAKRQVQADIFRSLGQLQDDPARWEPVAGDGLESLRRLADAALRHGRQNEVLLYSALRVVRGLAETLQARQGGGYDRAGLRVVDGMLRTVSESA